MRRLITLHIGRGLNLYRPVLRVSAFLSWVSGVDCLSPAFIDLPISGRVPFQLEGLHPVDAAALAKRLLLRRPASGLRSDGARGLLRAGRRRAGVLRLVCQVRLIKDSQDA